MTVTNIMLQNYHYQDQYTTLTGNGPYQHTDYIPPKIFNTLKGGKVAYRLNTLFRSKPS